MASISEKWQVPFAEKPEIKINGWKKQNHGYLIHTWSDKTFKGTVVNWSLSAVFQLSCLVGHLVFHRPTPAPYLEIEVWWLSWVGGVWILILICSILIVIHLLSLLTKIYFKLIYFFLHKYTQNSKVEFQAHWL